MNVPHTKPRKGTASYYYPMDQSARFVWYHDHVMGITRTNVYAGIASALLLIDDFEIRRVNSGLLPDLVGIPLVIQDKSLCRQQHCHSRSYLAGGSESNLWYPHVYEKSRW